jgi:tRNA uridine 5-carboxymethylaminomethyl modification enzyme
VRFADKSRHTIFLEPESLQTHEMYCNGISTSLPRDVQDNIVAHLPGCEHAKILRYGYAVEYDMVLPHQIDATCMTKRLPGLFLAGQINGTTGYEEAGAQGVMAGLNAVRYTRGEDLVRLGRDQAYIGVLMDDLVTKVPREPYRMFTSRAEHRLMLRADNAPERLTALGRELGLVDDHRWSVYQQRQQALGALRASLDAACGLDYLKRPEVDHVAVLDQINGSSLPVLCRDPRTITALLSEIKYAPFVERHVRDHQRVQRMEHRPLPTDYDYTKIKGLRNEAIHVLGKFRPATFGQAARLAGINPADLTVLTIALGR